MQLARPEQLLQGIAPDTIFPTNGTQLSSLGSLAPHDQVSKTDYAYGASAKIDGSAFSYIPKLHEKMAVLLTRAPPHEQDGAPGSVFDNALKLFQQNSGFGDSQPVEEKLKKKNFGDFSSFLVVFGQISTKITNLNKIF